MKQRVWPVLVLLAALPGVAVAQQPLHDATVEQIVDQLAPPAASRGMTRNLVPQKRQIDLIVNFDFDSATLQASSRPLLGKLAEALNTERLQSMRFRVEGHTDAKGGADYNQRLSERRASAVVGFLEANGVARGRLDAQGMGARELLNAADPLAAENRRVRISALE